MSELWYPLIGSFLILTFTVTSSYRRSRDAMHPLILLCPMFIYMYIYLPGYLVYSGNLIPYLGGERGTMVAVGYTAASAAMVALGCWRHRISGTAITQATQSLSPLARKRLVLASYIIGFGGLLVFFLQLEKGGGFVTAYSRPKGGGSSLGSGYINEIPLLTIPAIILYMMGRYGRHFALKSFLVLLAFASPHIIQGTFGGRRGPAFIGFGALFFGWHLMRQERPRLRNTVLALSFMGLLLIFLANFRQIVYLGSTAEFQPKSLSEMLLSPTEEEAGDTVYMLGSIKAGWLSENYQWGKAYIVQLLIRPIPSRLWPNKYTSLGMGWMEDNPGSQGLTPFQWLSTVGWVPSSGSASGLAGDTFLQFSWGGLLLCWLVGNVYGYLWKKTLLLGGVWNILYFEACVLSVYLPTQGLISAWGYRLLFLSGATVLFWKYLTRRGAIEVHRSKPLLARRSMYKR